MQTPHNSSQTLQGDLGIFVIIAAYGRSVTCAQDIWSHLEFVGPPQNQLEPSGDHISQAIYPTDSIMTQFQHKLHRYITGIGHPEHRLIGEDFVNAEERSRDAHSNTIRARKFLRFATGSELMPHGTWKIRVCAFFLYSESDER